MTMNAMRPAGNYDLTEITRLLMKMRDNCVRKAEGEAYDDPERKEKYAVLDDAIDLINNPSLLLRWFSVKERLPEQNTAVIVAVDDGHVFQTLYAYDGWDLWEGCTCNVTHWMPLPVPPEEEV